MADYTFHTLSPADFEDLACDLLTAALGLRFQAFATGPDQGIDLLHGVRAAGGIVVQCKHFARSSYSNLKAKLVSDELPKISKLAPQRYLLVTSIALTPGNKEELLDVLRPHCLGMDDIYGLDDVNTLLRKFPAIETSHYKLWLTSTAVLQRVLRHGAAVWNSISKDDIQRKMSLYVQTDAFRVASEITSKYNYCVLSGIPGIGKTTLAQVLVTRLIEDGFELVAVRHDIQEALDALDLARKQVVYYDDFLGQSNLSERLSKNEDHGIVRLIEEARRHKNLKVILTTREYILEDAKKTYEPLARGDLDVAKCVVRVEDYTRGHRARILYNHVYFSGLSPEFADALVNDKSYRRIIDHKGYNPRIVEWMTIGGGTAGIQPEKYVTAFLGVLDNPTRIWEHAFENQLGEDARAVLYCLGTFESAVGLDELGAVWRLFRTNGKDAENSIEQRRAYHAALHQLDGTFIKTARVRGNSAIEFHNPSIKDYVRVRVVSEPEVRLQLLQNATFFEQVSCLIRMNDMGQVSYEATRLIEDNPVLHRAIRRSIESPSATYFWLRVRPTQTLTLIPETSDIGERLSQVARWALTYKSDEIFETARKYALDAVRSGDRSKIVSPRCFKFLAEAVKQDRLNKRDGSDLVLPILAEVNEALAEQPSIYMWDEWTNFFMANRTLFDAGSVESWTERAHSFCSDDLTDLINESDLSSSTAEERCDEIKSIASRWDFPLDLEDEVNAKLEALREREEERSNSEEWGGATQSEQVSGNDVDIDRWFSSLNESRE